MRSWRRSMIRVFVKTDETMPEHELDLVDGMKMTDVIRFIDYHIVNEDSLVMLTTRHPETESLYIRELL